MQREEGAQHGLNMFPVSTRVMSHRAHLSCGQGGTGKRGAVANQLYLLNPDLRFYKASR